MSSSKSVNKPKKSTGQKSKGKSVDPIRRDIRFNIPADKINDWHRDGKHVALFLNTLSMFFPEGERFFIDSVRHYRDKGLITDKRLLKQVRAFIGQEAMHGREHEEYNEAGAASGLPIREQEELVVKVLDVARKLPMPMQLGATIALEHYTAIMADGLLRDPELIKGSDPNMVALWNWHALEETEHKSVAFDVYREVMGNTPLAYVNRVVAMVLATVIFWALVYPFYVQNVRKAGGLFSLRGWIKSIDMQFGKIGFMRKLLPDYLAYFKPGFHPWDQDNRHFLDQMDGLVEEVERLAKAA